MANTINKYSRLWTFNVADIISAAPICIRKIVFRPAGETNTAVLHSCNLGAAPDCSASLTNVTVTSESQIEDIDNTSPFNGAATGDWLHIIGCDTAADDGWYRINTVSDADTIIVEKGLNVLTDDTSVAMIIKTYSPEAAMNFVADDISTNADNVVKHELDWGERGRWFPNLALYSISSTNCMLDIYIK